MVTRLWLDVCDYAEDVRGGEADDLIGKFVEAAYGKSKHALFSFACGRNFLVAFRHGQAYNLFFVTEREDAGMGESTQNKTLPEKVQFYATVYPFLALFLILAGVHKVTQTSATLATKLRCRLITSKQQRK
jgi:hypothetical protein